MIITTTVNIITVKIIKWLVLKYLHFVHHNHGCYSYTNNNGNKSNNPNILLMVEIMCVNVVNKNFFFPSRTKQLLKPQFSTTVTMNYSTSNPNPSSGEHNNYWSQRYRLSKCFDEKIKTNSRVNIVPHRY